MKTQLRLGQFISSAIASLVFSSVVLAQSAPPAPRLETVLIPAPLTKLETFAAKTGSLLATESYTLIRIYGEKSCSIRLQVIVMYEIGREDEKVQGLRVEIADSTQKNSIFAYVDLDELENLSRAINSMLDLNQKGTSFTNPFSKELFFSSTGGLRFAMVQKDTQKELVVTHRFADGSCIVSRDTSVIELKTAIDKVLEELR
jgi:hypothetical protein